MSSLRIASIVAALMILASGGLADPIARGVEARKTYAPPPAQTTDNGYYVPYVIGADGKRYPIMEIRGSVSVISRQVMDDQQAITLGDALRNVSGVTVIGR
jgi:outer membrane receptor for ferric coprogen and ferric-rhodotorulic acid